MANTKTFMGHETFMNNMKMTMQMVTTTTLLAILCSIMIIAFLYTQDAGAKTDVAMVKANITDAWEHYRAKRVTKDRFYDYTKQQLLFLVKARWYYIALFLIANYFLYRWVLGFFQRKAMQEMTNTHIRGPKMIPAELFNHEVRKRGFAVRFNMGPVSMPKGPEIEKAHVRIVGSTGSRKTSSYFMPFLAALMEQKCRGLVHDVKGDFVSRFLRYEGASSAENAIYCPVDPRGVAWTVFNDIERATDIEMVAHRLIPDNPNLKDPHWQMGARDILIGLMHYAFLHEETTNRELCKIFDSPIIKKLEYLEDTDEGARGRDHLSDPDSNMSKSYNSVFSLHTHCFKYLLDGDFSVTKWLKNEGHAGFIFVLNHPEIEDAIRPALRLFIDTLTSKMFSLGESDRSIFLLLDEFSSLGTMPSMLKLLKLGRGVGAAVSLGVQEYGQIDKYYGRDDRKTILGNLLNSVTFNVQDPDTAAEISRSIGDAEIIQPIETNSGGHSNMKDGISVTKNIVNKTLVMPSELPLLPDGHAYVKIKGFDYVKADVSARRVYARETEKNRAGVRRDAAFKLRSGLTLDEIHDEHARARAKAEADKKKGQAEFEAKKKRGEAGGGAGVTKDFQPDKNRERD